MTYSIKNLKIGMLPLGIVLTIIITIALALNLFSGDKTYFLSGDVTHGHYQIQLECQSCHKEAFSTADQMQQSCEQCHAKELDKINDSHPKKKFLDPRNAQLLNELDARYCVTCHKEHKPEITREFGVTLAKDFCIHCHQDLAEDKPNHKDIKFMDCTNSGCHNFHDNSMLYEKFLARHIDEPKNLASQLLPIKTELSRWLKKNKREVSNNLLSADIKIQQGFIAKEQKVEFEKATQLWESSVHAKTNTECGNCHVDQQSNAPLKIENIEVVCKKCHKRQHKTFMQGKHGFRLSLGLTAVSTEDSKLPMDQQNNASLGCASCHDPHSVNVIDAAVDACLECHQDQHSLNYKKSTHFKLWLKELSDELKPASGVSCASCHLPRIKKGKRVEVIHNQNLNLQPNSKMLRKVCMNCHGLEYSLSALADEELIKNNFTGEASSSHPTFRLIKERLKLKNEVK